MHYPEAGRLNIWQHIRVMSDAEAPELASTAHARTCTWQNTALYSNAVLGVKMLLPCTTRVLVALLLPNTTLAQTLLPLTSAYHTYCTVPTRAECMHVFGVVRQDSRLPWLRQELWPLDCGVSLLQLSHLVMVLFAITFPLAREGKAIQYWKRACCGGFTRAMLFILLQPCILHSWNPAGKEKHHCFPCWIRVVLYSGESRKHFCWTLLCQCIVLSDGPEGVLWWALPKQGRLSTCKGDCTTVLQTVRQRNSHFAISIPFHPAWYSVMAWTVSKHQAELEGTVLSHKVKKRS